MNNGLTPNAPVLFAFDATNFCIWRTDDGGRTWRKWIDLNTISRRHSWQMGIDLRCLKQTERQFHATEW
jgi:hypothetical protein